MNSSMRPSTDTLGSDTISLRPSIDTFGISTGRDTFASSSLRPSVGTLRPSFDTLGTEAPSARPSIDSLGLSEVRPSIDSKGLSTLGNESPGTPKKGKSVEVEKKAKTADAGTETVTISVGNLDIVLTPKKATHKAKTAAKQGLTKPPAGKSDATTNTSPTRSSTASPAPSFSDASVQTEGDGLEGKEISISKERIDASVQTEEAKLPKGMTAKKLRLKENSAFIAEMIQERNKLDAVILERVAENDEITRELVNDVASETAKVEDLEKEYDKLSGELVEWRYNTRMLKGKAANVFKEMDAFQRSLKEFSASTQENDGRSVSERESGKVSPLFKPHQL